MSQRIPVCGWFAATAYLMASAACAQVEPPAAAPASATLPMTAPPATAHPASAPLPYQSVFKDYRPFSHDKVLPWKDSNQTVERIGGWRAYATEATDAVAKDPQGTTPAPADPHAGHAKH